MIEAPLRDVVRAFESTGPRGGRELVHVLECGCWVINRRATPAKRLRCIACRVREEQGGWPRHGVPRVEDIAWQAFQAGTEYGRRAANNVLKNPSALWPSQHMNRAFREWWAKR